MAIEKRLEETTSNYEPGEVLDTANNLGTVDEVTAGLGGANLEIDLRHQLAEKELEDRLRNEEIKQNACKYLDEVLSEFDESESEEASKDNLVPEAVPNVDFNQRYGELNNLQHQLSISRNEAEMRKNLLERKTNEYDALLNETRIKDKNLNDLIAKVSDLKNTNIDLSKELAKAKSAIHDLSKKISEIGSSNEAQEIRIIEKQNKEMLVDKFTKEITQVKAKLQESETQNLQLKSSLRLSNDRLSFAINESKTVQEKSSSFLNLLRTLILQPDNEDLFENSHAEFEKEYFECLREIRNVLLDNKKLKENVCNFEFESNARNIFQSPNGKIFNSTQHANQDNVNFNEHLAEYIKKNSEQEHLIKDLNFKLEHCQNELNTMREKEFEMTCNSIMKGIENNSTRIMTEKIDSGVQTDEQNDVPMASSAHYEKILKEFIRRSINTFIEAYNLLVANFKQESDNSLNDNEIQKVIKSVKFIIIKKKMLFGLINNRKESKIAEELIVKKIVKGYAFLLYQITQLLKNKSLKYIADPNAHQVTEFVNILRDLRTQVTDYMSGQEVRIKELLKDS
ncbi:MAG: hypothetical protein MHMPM18_003978 [Marteilia pararefringens]